MNKKTDILFRVLSLVVFIFLLVVLAISFLQSRKVSSMNACIANMKQLEGARDQALLAGSSASIKGSPATHSTAPVHAVYGPVVSPRLFDDCPGQPLLPSDP
jgi:hypothetical protein